MAALDAAFPLAQVDGVAGPIGQHLHFHVARIGDVPLQKHAAVTEGGLRLAAGQFHVAGQILPAVDQAHTATAAAGRRFHHQGEPPPLRKLRGFCITRLAGGRAGYGGDAGGDGDILGAQFVAQSGHALRRRADERDPRVLAGPGKFGVLGQETVAGVDGVGSTVSGGLNNPGDVEVGILGCTARQDNGLLCRVDMVSVGVRLGIDGDGSDAHSAKGLADADGDLAAIGYQDFGEHRFTYGKRRAFAPGTAR